MICLWLWVETLLCACNAGQFSQQPWHRCANGMYKVTAAILSAPVSGDALWHGLHEKDSPVLTGEDKNSFPGWLPSLQDALGGSEQTIPGGEREIRVPKWDSTISCDCCGVGKADRVHGTQWAVGM